MRALVAELTGAGRARAREPSPPPLSSGRSSPRAPLAAAPCAAPCADPCADEERVRGWDRRGHFSEGVMYECAIK